MGILFSFVESSIISSIESWLLKELMYVLLAIVAVIVGIVLVFKGVFWLFSNHEQTPVETPAEPKPVIQHISDTIHDHTWWLVWLLFGLIGSTSYMYVKSAYMERQYTATKTENSKLTAEVNDLRNTANTLIATNKDNVSTIESLKRERIRQIKAVEAVNAQNRTITDRAAELEAKIDAADPSKNGKLSPVLQDTLKELQK